MLGPLDGGDGGVDVPGARLADAGQHGAGAPGDAREQGRRGGHQPHQVVAAVGRRPEHRLPGLEGRSGRFEGRRCAAISRARSPPPPGCWSPAKHSVPPTPIPARASARVGSSTISTSRPARRLSTIAGPRSIMTPTTWILGSADLRAKAIPPSRPPPDNGTTTVSKPGNSSSSSRPIVPCPAMMSGSSYPWM